jgi:hypothetical protein
VNVCVIDTVKLRYSGLNLNERFYNEMQERHIHATVRSDCRGCLIRSTEVGNITTWGSNLYAEMSIGRYVNGNNMALLTCSEALDALDAYMQAVEVKFKPYALVPDLRRTAAIKRADFYYQQRVPSIADALNLMANAMPNRSRMTRRETSLSYQQNRNLKARWYCKGTESKTPELYGVLRHEEEVRDKDRLGFLIDLQSMTVRREAVRHYMNERYEGIDFTSPMMDAEFKQYLVKAYRQKGLAAIALALDSSLHEIAKRELARNTYFEDKRLANDLLARSVQIDLRVPADAWEEDAAE